MSFTFQQIPENWPVVSPEGVVVGILVFIVVTLIAYYITHSKWSWLPGLIFGVIAAIAVTQYYSTQALDTLTIFILRITGG